MWPFLNYRMDNICTSSFCQLLKFFQWCFILTMISCQHNPKKNGTFSLYGKCSVF